MDDKSLNRSANEGTPSRPRQRRSNFWPLWSVVSSGRLLCNLWWRWSSTNISDQECWSNFIWSSTCPKERHKLYKNTCKIRSNYRSKSFTIFWINLFATAMYIVNFIETIVILKEEKYIWKFESRNVNNIKKSIKGKLFYILRNTV